MRDAVVSTPNLACQSSPDVLAMLAISREPVERLLKTGVDLQRVKFDRNHSEIATRHIKKALSFTVQKIT